MKNNVCILAIDDSPHRPSDFHKYQTPDTLPPQVSLFGIVTKGLMLLEVLKTTITVDGTDATDAILTLFNQSKYKTEIRIIMVDSPTLAAFNIPNYSVIMHDTKCPLLLIPDETPGSIPLIEVFKKAFPNRPDQISWLLSLPPLDSLVIRLNRDSNVTKEIYFYCVGISKDEVTGLIHFLTEFSSVPEPLRLAHLIASHIKCS